MIAVELVDKLMTGLLSSYPTRTTAAYLGEISASEHRGYCPAAALAMADAFLDGPVSARR